MADVVCPDDNRRFCHHYRDDREGEGVAEEAAVYRQDIQAHADCGGTLDRDIQANSGVYDNMADDGEVSVDSAKN